MTVVSELMRHWQCNLEFVDHFKDIETSYVEILLKG